MKRVAKIGYTIPSKHAHNQRNGNIHTETNKHKDRIDSAIYSVWVFFHHQFFFFFRFRGVREQIKIRATTKIN